MEAKRLLAAAQAATFIGTGIWPILSIRSFEAVTGRKRDRWLVKSMGALITAVGGALAVGAKAPALRRETALLGAAAAATLAACDVVFVAKGRIPKVYLLDAVLESAFVASWITLWPEESEALERREDAEAARSYFARRRDASTEGGIVTTPAAEQRPPADS